MTVACPYCHKRFGSEAAMMQHGSDKHGRRIEAEAATTAEPVDPTCIECGKVAALVKGDTIYPHRPDLYAKNFWLCECGAYCGCHGVTTRPLGSPCGADTRRARMAAHDRFDPLWRSGQMTRREAYTWLSKSMGLDSEQTHIGMFTREQALTVVRLVNERRNRRPSSPPPVFNMELDR